MSGRILEAVVTLRSDQDAGGSQCGRLVSRVIAGWRNGAPVDAVDVIACHPELRRYNALVLDLAYVEFCLRRKRGEAIASADFCENFPEIKTLLRQQIDLHELIAIHPELLESHDPHVAAKWPTPGTNIQGFTVLRELGRGAFARVFLATEDALGNRQVALKVCRHGAAEAQILGKLRHRNIVPIYSARCDESAGFAVICMPYLGRATLSNLVDLHERRRLPRRMGSVLDAIRWVNKDLPAPPADDDAHGPRRRTSYVSGVIAIGAQLADALSVAHRLGILHLDLKPSNILVTASGTPKLIDFNLAVDLQSEHQRLGGTLPYMSPEQLRCTLGDRDAAAIDHRSDIFSLGVVLYQLLTGDLPQGWPTKPQRSGDGAAAADMLARYEADGAPSWPGKLDVNRRLKRIVERCLAVDPDQRYQDADELKHELRRELTVPRRVRRRLSAHPRLVVAAYLLLAAACLGLAVHLGTRPPYDVRQFRQGLTAFRSAQYDAAIRHCDLAIEREPRMAQAYFLRGESYADLGHYAMAMKDLSDGYRLAPDAAEMAFLGYCAAKQRMHPEAIIRYERARDAGFESAALYNNLGYSRLRSGQYRLALPWLDIAIRMDSHCQEAFFNRALVHVWIAQQEDRAPEEALADIQTAISLGHAAGEHYRIAAAICVEMNKHDGGRMRQAAEYLRLAVTRGATLDNLRKDPRFVDLLRDPIVLSQLQEATGGAGQYDANQLIDPRPSARTATAQDERPPFGQS